MISYLIVAYVIVLVIVILWDSAVVGIKITGAELALSSSSFVDQEIVDVIRLLDASCWQGKVARNLAKSTNNSKLLVTISIPYSIPKCE